MKTKIHPEYVESRVHCACGNEWHTRSTKPDLHVEICSNCHPFFTGQQRIVDTAGRVERFAKRLEKSQVAKATAKPKKQKKTMYEIETPAPAEAAPARGSRRKAADESAGEPDGPMAAALAAVEPERSADTALTPEPASETTPDASEEAQPATEEASAAE
jgi:large subunit ribosomal protein L31